MEGQQSPSPARPQLTSCISSLRAWRTAHTLPPGHQGVTPATFTHGKFAAALAVQLILHTGRALRACGTVAKEKQSKPYLLVVILIFLPPYVKCCHGFMPSLFPAPADFCPQLAPAHTTTSLSCYSCVLDRILWVLVQDDAPGTLFFSILHPSSLSSKGQWQELVSEATHVFFVFFFFTMSFV